MRKKIIRQIEIPKNVEVVLDGSNIIVSGPAGKSSKKFAFGKVIFEKKEDKIILKHEKATKKEKKIIHTLSAHIKNMLEGVQKKFEYKLKICASHFPISVKIEGDKAIIKNFLGEKKERQAKILPGAEARVEKDVIIITSIDKDIVGQTAANFETATRIRNRDRRVFQDGIYITNKSGEDI